MRAYDFAPLYRATVGFDRIADLLDSALTNDVDQSTYPPYNIEKTDDAAYRISVAVAGFSAEDLNIEQRENKLTISAKKVNDDADTTYLHRGIATRAFDRRFQLADHVRVTGATQADGMLHIDLIREVPEALKPRQIAIESPKALEHTIDA
ncbi:MAG: Hsp20 family protein [Litoreibacter sp.]